MDRQNLRHAYAKMLHLKLSAAQNLPYEEGSVCEECYGIADELLALASEAECSGDCICCYANEELHAGVTEHCLYCEHVAP